MKIANISYLNLFPFRIFLKKRKKSFSEHLQSIKRGSYPSNINKSFQKRAVEAAFISSIRSVKSKKTECGIVAQKEVWSVVAKAGEEFEPDLESATSNALAKILGIKGKVYIGDKALKLYLKEPSSYVDLCREWNKKTGLPFVFACFCFNKNGRLYQRLSKDFLKKPQKLPQYYLKDESYKKGINPKKSIEYLKLISYKIGRKESLALKKFLKKAKL